MFRKYKNLPKSVYIICLGILLTNLGSYVYPLFVFIASDYGFDYSDISLILSIFVIGTIIGTFISGQLIDKVGRKKTFTVFMFLSGLMFALLPFTSKYSFVVLVVLANIFTGISKPAARVMIVDLTTQAQRKEALALRYIALNVGFSFGPAIGAFLYTINVNILYLGDGITTMLFAVIIMLFVAETKPTDAQMDAHDVKGERKINGTIFAVLKQKPELVYLTIFSTFLIVTFTQFNFGLPATTDIIKGETLGPIVFGIIMTINGVTVTLMTPVITKFMENKKSSFGLILSGLFMAAGYSMYAYITATWLFYVAAFLWSCGEALWVVNFITYETNHTPINHRGRVSAFITNVLSVAKIIVMYLSGVLIESVSTTLFWVIIPSFAVMSSLVALKLHRYNLDAPSLKS